jgi:hypothetical protein
MKFVPICILALLLGLGQLPAFAAPLYETKSIKSGKKTIQVQERGNTLFFQSNDYDVSFRDVDGDNFYDEKVLRKGKIEMRLFDLQAGEFRNMEIRERRKEGILRSIFYRKGKEYKLLEAQMRPYKTYFQGLPILGAAYQACRSEIEDYASQNGLDWRKIISAINESEMLGYLRANNVVDESCRRGKFKDSEETILKAIASVLSTYKTPGEEARFLGCLQNRRLGGLGDSLIENILTQNGENKVSIQCRDRRDDEETAGSFDNKRRVIYLHEAYEKEQNAGVAKKLYARTFFHEAIHSCGVEDETHVHAIENCCSDDSASETKAHCKQADEITAREHRIVTYATAFSRYLPGFDDFWRELVSFKDAEAEKDIFDYFIVGSDKIYKIEQEKTVACISERLKDRSGGQVDLSPCYEASFTRTYEQSSVLLDEVCEKYFDNEKMPEKIRERMQQRCQSFQEKLAQMLKRGFQENCEYSDTIDGPKDKCINVAMMDATRNYSKAPDISKTYEKMSEARTGDQMRYFNSLYLALAKSTPKLDEFSTKVQQKFLDAYVGRGGMSAEQKKHKAAVFAREQQALLMYRYFGMLDKSFPRSEVGNLSFECRAMTPEQSRDCEKKRVERVTRLFFRFVCPSTVSVENTEEICSEFGKSMQAVWADSLDRCPLKNDPEKGFQCYQNVFAESVKIYADPYSREQPSFAYPFWDKENPTPEELRIISSYKMAPVERAYLSAMQYKLKGGRVFFEQAMTDVDTSTAQRVILDYARYLRSREVGSMRGDKKEDDGLGAYKLYELCLNNSVENQDDCHKSAIARLQKHSQEYFEKFCPARLDTEGEACARISKLATELVQNNLSRPNCKLAGETGESFACLANVYETAATLALDSSKNRFEWPAPLRRSADHMQRLIERLNGADKDTGNLDLSDSTKPETRVRIDFSDYDKMRRTALAVEDRSGALAEMGQRLADAVAKEASKLGTPEAHAEDKVPRNPNDIGSQLVEGKRFYGSEANPWSSRNGEEYQENFEKHSSTEFDRNGNTRGNQSADDASRLIAPPPATVRAPKQAGNGASSARQTAAPTRTIGPSRAIASVAPSTGGGGGGSSGGGAPFSPPAAAKAGGRADPKKLGASTKADLPAGKIGDRSPATKEKAIDATAIRYSHQDLVKMAKESPQIFISQLENMEFVQLLKFHKILVIVKEKSYGSLDSATVLTFNEKKSIFETLRLGEDE